MKKNLLIIAAATLVLASCSDSEKLNRDLNESKANAPMTFSAYSDVITRATDAKNSTKLNDFYDIFAVYGWKTIGSNTAQDVFINIPNEYFTDDEAGTKVYTGSKKPSDEWVVPNDISATKGYWYYENIRYWDKLATYQFFAIAPYDESSTPYYKVNAGADNFSLYEDADNKRYDISTEDNLMASKPEKDLKYYRFKKDFLIADKKTTADIAATVAASNQDVNLVFHHILSKLNVMIKKDADFKGKQNLAVTDLKIANLKKEGSFVYTTSMTTNGWTTTGTYDIALTGKNFSLNSTTAADNYDECYWVENLIFPQDITCKKAYVNNAIVPQSDTDNLDTYLYIAYKIGDEKFEAYYDLANVFGIGTANSTFSFAQGSQYRLTITVGPKPIHFTAEVTAWAEEDTHNVNVD